MSSAVPITNYEMFPSGYTQRIASTLPFSYILPNVYINLKIGFNFNLYLYIF